MLPNTLSEMKKTSFTSGTWKDALARVYGGHFKVGNVMMTLGRSMIDMIENMPLSVPKIWIISFCVKEAHRLRGGFEY